MLLVGPGDQIFIGGSADVVLEVILEEGEAVVEGHFFRAGQCLAKPAIDDQLFYISQQYLQLSYA